MRLALTIACLAFAPAALAGEARYSPPGPQQKTAFVAFDGMIGPGDADRLDTALQKAQGSGRQLAVTLGSSGGDFEEAMAMGRVIRRYEADTYHAYCAAACSFAFLGGARRFMLQDDAMTALIVHRPPFAEALLDRPNPSRALRARLDVLRDYALEMTGDGRAYSFIMSFSSSSPHKVTEAEALEQKIITQALH